MTFAYNAHKDMYVPLTQQVLKDNIGIWMNADTVLEPEQAISAIGDFLGFFDLFVDDFVYFEKMRVPPRFRNYLERAKYYMMNRSFTEARPMEELVANAMVKNGTIV